TSPVLLQYRNLPSCTPGHPLPVRVQVLDSNSTPLSADTAVSVPELGQMLLYRGAAVLDCRSVTQPSTGLDFAADGLYGCHAAGALGRLDFRNSCTTISLRSGTASGLVGHRG